MGTLSRAEPRRGAFATCWELLPHVSRTFALAIPALAEPLRTHVGVAYLLCRIADTVEDADAIPPLRRRELFGCLLELVERPLDPQERQRFMELWCGRVDRHHEALMRSSGDVLLAFASLPQSTRLPIRQCLGEMIGGMATSPAAEKDLPVEACPDLVTLERYCHGVAGTVGILLSRLFALELRPDWLTPERLEQGRRFGLGLQLTNILKDERGDRERGITYIPALYRTAPGGDGGLSRDGARILIGRTLEHLDEAHAYILSVPVKRPDMRLFCLWAAHLALATLARAASHPGQPAKISREQVRAVQESARSRVADNMALDALHRDLRDAVTRALTG